MSINDDEPPWEYSEPGEYTIFLDIKYTFREVERLQTDVNIKKTDARAYLHFSSYHPKQPFPSIVFSQCLRYRRIINCTDRLKVRLMDLKLCFLQSGYPNKMVQGVIDVVLQRPRSLEYKPKLDTPPFPVVWVQTFSPATEE